MPWFFCDACGDSIKKPALSKHFCQCRGQSFTCIDCSVTFDRKAVVNHSTCVTEHEKYALGATKPGGFAANGFGGGKAAENGPAEATGLEFLSTRPPWKCSVCNVSCTSKETLLSHAAGVKHKRRARAATGGATPGVTPTAITLSKDDKDLPPKRPAPSSSSSSEESSSSDDDSGKKNPKVQPVKKMKHASSSSSDDSSSSSDEEDVKKSKKNSVPQKAAGKKLAPDSSSSDSSSDEEEAAPVKKATPSNGRKTRGDSTSSSSSSSEEEEEEEIHKCFKAEDNMKALAKLVSKKLQKKGSVGLKLLVKLAIKKLNIKEKELTTQVLEQLRQQLVKQGICKMQGKKLVNLS